MKDNRVTHSMHTKVQNRRRKVILRLEQQLKSNTKHVTERFYHETTGGTAKIDKIVGLTEHDVARITRELETLKTRC